MLKCVSVSGLLVASVFVLPFYAEANPTLSEIKKQQEDLKKNVQTESINQNLVEELAVDNIDDNQQVSDGVSFILTGVTISGNQVLTKQELEPLIKPLINQSVTGDTLRNLSKRISEILSEKGFRTSRAFVPPQEIKNGLVEIRVEEDRLAGVQVLGKDSFKYNESLFYQYFSDLRGKIIHTPTLVERLKYLNFLPGTRIKPTLKKIEFGKSALILVLEPVDNTTAIAINNNASKFQGELRTTFSSLVTNATGRSDNLNFFAAVNPEYPKYFSSVAASYSVPFGDKGAKVNLNFSQLDYMLDPEALSLQAFLYSGSSESLSVSYQKPFWLDWGNNSWSVGIEKRTATSQTTNNFEDNLVGGQIGFVWVDQKETLYGLDFAAQFVFSDQWLAESLPSQNLVNVKFTKILEGFMDGLTQEDIDFKQVNEDNEIFPVKGPVGDTRQATANFWKLYLSYVRRQALPLNINMNFQINAEYANFDNIPSSYDYGGADSGTSGGDWSLSLSRTFVFDQYLDWLNLEFGYEQQVAYNVFFPTKSQPFGDEVASCGGKVDLIAYERFRCEVSTPFASLRLKSDQHMLWLRYKAELPDFGLTDHKATLSYTYIF